MTTATHNGHDTTPERALFVAFALSEKTWKLGFTTGHGQQPRERGFAARNQARVLQSLRLRPGQPLRRHPPLSCAACPGRDGPRCALRRAAPAGRPRRALGGCGQGGRHKGFDSSYPLPLTLQIRVIVLLSYRAEGGRRRSTGMRAHTIEPAILPLDLCEEALKIAKVRHVALTAAANSGSRRPVMKTYAPSFTNCCAVARPMPLLPPVMRAIFPSSLFLYSSPLITACQMVRTTLPKGRPSTRYRSASAASASGKVFATIGVIAPDCSRGTIAFQASAQAACG
jgi:hypothetical protein